VGIKLTTLAMMDTDCIGTIRAKYPLSLIDKLKTQFQLVIKKNVRPQMPSIFAAVKKYHGRHLFHFLEGKPKILSYKKSKRQDWVAQTFTKVGLTVYIIKGEHGITMTFLIRCISYMIQK
jgi:hypothetical protein